MVEVLETVAADPDVVAACRSLKDAGYMIALDDYVANDPPEELVEIADIIKVEMQLTTEEQRTALMKRLRVGTAGCWRKNRNAARVCTRTGSGICVFPGIFFRRPEMMKSHDMPANQVNFLGMLQAVSRPELNFDELEKLVKAEAAVCHRLLRYLNSPMFSFQNEIHSVWHGSSILGERDIRRWGAAGGGSERRAG